MCRALYKHLGRNSHQLKESAIQIGKKVEKNREMWKRILFLRVASIAYSHTQQILRKNLKQPPHSARAFSRYFSVHFQNIFNSHQAAKAFNERMLTTSCVFLSSQTTQLSVILAETVILTSVLPLITILQVAKKPKLPIIVVK